MYCIKNRIDRKRCQKPLKTFNLVLTDWKNASPDVILENILTH